MIDFLSPKSNFNGSFQLQFFTYVSVQMNKSGKTILNGRKRIVLQKVEATPISNSLFVLKIPGQ